MSSAPARAGTGTVRQWSLRRRVGGAFAALAGLLVVLLTITVASLIAFVSRGQDVLVRWEPAVLASQDLLADLVNQETGVRGYALSGLEEFLQPYTQFGRRETTDSRRLRTYLHGHAGALGQLDSVEQAAATWRAEIAGPVIAAVRASDPSAAARVDNVIGKARFDLIRARAAALTGSVRGLLNQAKQGRYDAEVFFFVALSVTFGLVAAAGVALWRGLHRLVLGPVDRLADQARQVAGGDLNRVIVPGGPPEVAELGSDVETMRRRIADELTRAEAARQELVVRSAELGRSNDDLEQFAYVASHDLSEPLRKVANFCQLLERQYGPQLDDKARQYIEFAVDGAKRMQALINDLLAFSRVGRSTARFVRLDTGAVLARVCDDLADEIRAAGAQVSHDPLPTVWGEPSLLTSLLVNLVGNSVKYCDPDAPRVHVSARTVPEGWLFTVADNGIGIDAQHAERIFAIFQRLHLRDEYGGTGIGLALCRKIVEFHGGRLWLEPSDGSPGATFRFTLPEGPTDDR